MSIADKKHYLRLMREDPNFEPPSDYWEGPAPNSEETEQESAK